jgi:hypothetical protein
MWEGKKEEINKIREDVDVKVNQTAKIWGLTSTQAYVSIALVVFILAIGVKIMF